MATNERDIDEEVENHMETNGFNIESEDDCKDYCDWLDGYIDNLKGGAK